VEGRLDAVASLGVTNWFMAVDPSQIDTIEYCYLEGQQGVYIETRQGFEVDGRGNQGTAGLRCGRD